MRSEGGEMGSKWDQWGGKMGLSKNYIQRADERSPFAMKNARLTGFPASCYFTLNWILTVQVMTEINTYNN